MGLKKQIDVIDVVRQIHAAAYECSSPYLDGFNGWEIKQDLYQIKWILEDALKRCPHFTPEDEWVREQEKKRVIRILKGDIQ